MRPGAHFFFLALMMAAALLSFLLRFDPGGILSRVLEYPAQGEEAANRNLWKVMFLVLPGLQLLGFFMAKVTLAAIDGNSSGGARARRIALAITIGAFLVLSTLACISGRSDLKSVLSHALVLSGYLGIFLAVEKYGKRLFHPSGPG